MRSGAMKTLAAASAGAGVAYLLDPDRGRARRAKLRDQTTSMMRREKRMLERRAHYERGRLEGIRHRVASRVGHTPENDQALVDKIRSEVLGRRPEIARHVSIDACAGVVTIRGQIPTETPTGDLESAIGAVTGVERIVNLLHGPGQDAPNKADALHASR